MTIPRLGVVAPDFTAATTSGTVRFHEWIGDDWAMLLSHSKHFTPVCTTELGTLAKLKPEFDRRRCEILGASTTCESSHPIFWVT